MYCRGVLIFLESPREPLTFCQNWLTYYYFLWKKKSEFPFLVAPCCSQGVTLQVTAMSSVQLSVCGNTPHPPPNVIPGQLRQLLATFVFRKNGVFFQIVFFSPPKKFFPLSLFMHFWMFYAILSAQKIFHPKLFGEARRDTMLPSISSLNSPVFGYCRFQFQVSD